MKTTFGFKRASKFSSCTNVGPSFSLLLLSLSQSLFPVLLYFQIQLPPHETTALFLSSPVPLISLVPFTDFFGRWKVSEFRRNTLFLWGWRLMVAGGVCYKDKLKKQGFLNKRVEPSLCICALCLDSCSGCWFSLILFGIVANSK